MAKTNKFFEGKRHAVILAFLAIGSFAPKSALSSNLLKLIYEEEEFSLFHMEGTIASPKKDGKAAWTQSSYYFEYSQPKQINGKLALSRVALIGFKCEENLYRYFSDGYFSEKLISGEIVYEKNLTEWSAVKSQSLELILKNHVCGNSNDSAYDAYYDSLDKIVPDWESINQSKEFLEWLKASEPLSGKTRAEMLTESFNQKDSQRTAIFFNEFKKFKAASESTARPGYFTYTFKGVTTYILESNIKPISKHIKEAKVLMSYGKEMAFGTGAKYQSGLYTIRFNCENHTMAKKETALFSGKRGDGKVVDVWRNWRLSWTKIIDGSPGEKQWSYVCR